MRNVVSRISQWNACKVDVFLHAELQDRPRHLSDQFRDNGFGRTFFKVANYSLVALVSHVFEFDVYALLPPSLRLVKHSAYSIGRYGSQYFVLN